jgi:TIR domain
VGRPGKITGHAFICYIHEDSHYVDQLQRTLESAGIPIWRDTADLWPGQDWRVKIRQAISSGAIVFIACFSSASLSRAKSYQNEELLLAIEQLRLRRPDDPWFIPVRFDDCPIPDYELGGGRTLASLQRVDLFGERAAEGIARLVVAVLSMLGQGADQVTSASSPGAGLNPESGVPTPGGQILISRTTTLVGTGTRAKIFIDGSEYGAIYNGQTLTFDISAGPHAIYCTTPGFKSRVINFTVTPGQKVLVNLQVNFVTIDLSIHR